MGRRKRFKGLSVAAVREKLDGPIPAGTQRNGDTTSYCVGGALCKFLDMVWDEFWESDRPYWVQKGMNFPGAEEIGQALQWVNPEIKSDVATRIGSEVINSNDSSQMENAWAWLAKGLEWKAEPFGREQATLDEHEAESLLASDIAKGGE